MKITFLGAAGTVTGSKYLLEHAGKKILIDCGLFQGYKELRLRNWDELPVDPATIDAVILTHAHIDHSGYIPLLVKNGFKGKIYCSEATFDLCSILLPDSGYLQEEDAKRANRYGYSKHHPAKPLYTKKDAENCLPHFKTSDFDEMVQIEDGFKFMFHRAGHILGAAFIALYCDRRKILFSGDLGRLEDPIMRTPTKIEDADYLFVESTYGDRLHEKSDPARQIGDIVSATVQRGGSVVIPSFAVGRSQAILYYLYQLKQAGAIPNVRIFLDSPMAINATNLLIKHNAEHRLQKKLCHDTCAVARYTQTVEESKAIEMLRMPSVIISASGMATGGRVLHHLKHFITNHKNTILFAGFQAGGTRGDRLLKGEETIKIHGEFFPVRAQIKVLSNLSAHADYGEILEWLNNFKKAPLKTFIVHGEASAAASLKEKIIKQYGWDVIIPAYLDSIILWE